MCGKFETRCRSFLHNCCRVASSEGDIEVKSSSPANHPQSIYEAERGKQAETEDAEQSQSLEETGSNKWKKKAGRGRA